MEATDFRVIGKAPVASLIMHEATGRPYYVRNEVWDGFSNHGSPWARGVVEGKVRGGDLAGAPRLWLPNHRGDSATADDRQARRERMAQAEHWHAKGLETSVPRPRANDLRPSDFEPLRESASGKAVLLSHEDCTFWAPKKIWAAFQSGGGWAAKWITQKHAEEAEGVNRLPDPEDYEELGESESGDGVLLHADGSHYWCPASVWEAWNEGEVAAARWVLNNMEPTDAIPSWVS